MTERILQTAKAVVSLVSAVGAALLTVYGPDTRTGHVLTIVVLVAGVVGTWAVRNKLTVSQALQAWSDVESNLIGGARTHHQGDAPPEGP